MSAGPVLPGSGPGRLRTTLAAAAAVLLALCLQVSVSLRYPLQYQHDYHLHVHYLRAIIKQEAFETYNSPWYYHYVALVGRAMRPVLGERRPAALPNLVAMTTVANALLLAAALAGLAALCRQGRLGATSTALVLALAGTSPPVVRSLCMLRPENLILGLAPGALAATLWLLPRRPGERVWWWVVLAGTSLALGLAAAQKVTGIAFVAGALGLIALAPGRLDRRRLAVLLGLGAGTVACLATLVVTQRLVRGTWFWEHHALVMAGYVRPGPSVFFSLPLADLWRDPLRNSAKGSMPGILLLDYFHDYWEYGAAHFSYSLDKTYTLDETWPVARARQGLLASCAFFPLWAACLASALRPARGRRESAAPEDPALRLLLLLPLLGLAYLVASGLRFYAPGDGDIFKWEYILPFLPFLPLAFGRCREGLTRDRERRALTAVLLAFVAVGVVQSLPVIWLAGATTPR